MKVLIMLLTIVVLGGACRSPKTSYTNPALRSEREYAQKSPEDANAEWAAAAKTAEQKQKQEAFEKDLDHMNTKAK